MKKRIYYFEDPIEFLTWYVKNKTEGLSLDSIISTYNADDEFKERVNALMIKENQDRRDSKAKAGKITQTTEDGQKATKIFRSKGTEALKALYGTEEWQKIVEKRWTEDSRKKASDVMRNMVNNMTDEEKKQRSIKIQEAMTPEIRTIIAEKGNITKRIKRVEYIKGIYDAILLDDWFTVEQAAEYCKEYNFSPNRNYRSLGLLLIDTEFFERKVLNIKPGKKVFYKKIQ